MTSFSKDGEIFGKFGHIFSNCLPIIQRFRNPRMPEFRNLREIRKARATSSKTWEALGSWEIRQDLPTPALPGNTDVPTFRNPIISEFPDVRKGLLTSEKKRHDSERLGRYDRTSRDPHFHGIAKLRNFGIPKFPRESERTGICGRWEDTA